MSSPRLLACLVLLLAFTGWHFSYVLDLSWTSDDPAIVLQGRGSEWLNYFYEPAYWQTLSRSNLTPLLTASLQLDDWFSGLLGAVRDWGKPLGLDWTHRVGQQETQALLSPTVFYAHQWLSMLILAGLLFRLVTRLTSPVWALATMCLVVIGAPWGATMEMLSTRHYLEGGIFAVLSLLVITNTVASERLSRMGLFAAGGFYALACSAKEVYVLLPMLVACWPVGWPWSERVRRCLPYLWVGLAYLAWRMSMLGGLAGGYSGQGGASQLFDMLGPFLQAVATFPELIGGNQPTPVLQVSAVLAGVCLLGLLIRSNGFQRLGLLAFAIAVAMAVLLPLLPLTKVPGFTVADRYLFVFWIVSVISASVCIHRFVSGRSHLRVVSNGLLLKTGVWVMFASVAVVTWQRAGEFRQTKLADYEIYRQQTLFLQNHGPEVAYKPDPSLLTAFWFVDHSCQLMEQELGPAFRGCPKPVIDGLPPPDAQEFYRYDRQAGGFRLEPDGRSVLLAREQQLRTDIGLTLELELVGGVARWAITPLMQGRYLIASESLGRFELPPSGQLAVVYPTLEAYAIFESPEGWFARTDRVRAVMIQP